MALTLLLAPQLPHPTSPHLAAQFLPEGPGLLAQLAAEQEPHTEFECQEGGGWDAGVVEDGIAVEFEVVGD